MQGGVKKTLLSEQERLCWLQLIRSENVGPQTFHQLLARFGSAKQALEYLPQLASRGGKRHICVASQQDAAHEMEQAQRQNVRFIAMGEPDYPALLRLVHAPPPLLAVKGDPAILTRNAISIVGARNASAVGQRLAAKFAKELGEADFVIISGFARGIDRAAHEASLQTGTIAVMAGGVDKIYPPENSALYKNIEASGGAIISEMPLGFEPRAQDFPRRNRLIAGMSLGTLVIEAARRSGSLITARLAGENGRLVFAIPGSPLDPNSGGSNDLIKQGAMLVDETSDIVEAIAPMMAPEQDQTMQDDLDFGFHEEGVGDALIPTAALDHSGRQRLVQCLSLTPIDLETLSIAADLSLPQLYLGLLELDLAGRLLHHTGGTVSLNINDDHYA